MNQPFIKFLIGKLGLKKYISGLIQIPFRPHEEVLLRFIQFMDSNWIKFIEIFT